MAKVKTFMFIEKNGDGVLTLSATDFEDANQILEEKVKHPDEWRVEDEDGDEDTEDF